MKKIISLSLFVLVCSNVKSGNDSNFLDYELNRPTLLDEVLTPNTIKELNDAFSNADQFYMELANSDMADNLYSIELPIVDSEDKSSNQIKKEEKYITLRNRVVVFRNIANSSSKKSKHNFKK